MSSKPIESRNSAAPNVAYAHRAWGVDTWICMIVSAWLVGCFVQLIYRLRYATPLLTDDLIYHLAIPAHWLRNGWNAPFTAWFHEAAPGYSPMLVERLAALLLLPASNEVWARWVQLPFQIGLCILTYQVLRSLSVRRDLACLTGASTLMLKPFLGESLSCHNDLALTCSFLLAVWGGLAARENRFRSGWTRFVGGSFLMMATKYVGLIYAAGLGLIMAALYFVARTRSNPSVGIQMTKRGVALRLVVIAGTMGLGLHTYVANWIQTGNPVFPASIKIDGLTLFPGLYSASEVRDYAISPKSIYNLLLDPAEAYTFSPISGGVATIGCLIMTMILMIRRSSANSGMFVIGVISWTLMAVYLLLVPFGEPRLLFPVYSLIWMGPAVLVNRWTNVSTGARMVAAGALVAISILACAEFNRAEHMLTPLTLGTALLIPAADWGFQRANAQHRNRLLVYSALIVAVVAGLFTYVYTEAYAIAYNKQRGFEHGYGDLGQAWTWIDVHTREEPAVIAFAGTSMRYPLYGQRLQNDVRYVHIGPDNFNTFHEYMTEMSPQPTKATAIQRCDVLFRSRRDVGYWLEQIRVQKIDLLFLARQSGSDAFPIEAEWAASHPDSFERVFDSSNVVIYRVKSQ